MPAPKVLTRRRLAIQHIGAAAVIFVGGGDQSAFDAGGEGDQVDGHVVFEKADIPVLAGPLQEHPLHFTAGHIVGVDDAVARVPALPAQIKGRRRLRRPGRPHRC
jgi:hypothetical protein